MFDDRLHRQSPLLHTAQTRGGTAPSRHQAAKLRYIAAKTARLKAEAAERRRAAIKRTLAAVFAGLRRLAHALSAPVSRSVDRLRPPAIFKGQPERRLG